MTQIDLYKQIDKFFTKGFKFATKQAAQSLINTNPDAKDYFFSHAPTEWISWLNLNGFFEILNNKAADISKYSFTLPELGYLVQVVESGKNDETVIKIINEVDCKKNFNPEVVDQFLWIAEKLSVENLIKIIPKIAKENWVFLMRKFRDSGFSYERLVRKLADAKEYKSFLILAKVMLTPNKEKSEENHFDKYFYLSDISETDLFQALSKFEGPYAEKAIKLILEIILNLIEPQNDDGTSIFKAIDNFYISGLDFFDLKLEDHSRLNPNDDLKSLLATLASLFQSNIRAADEAEAQKIYSSYINELPDSETLWRLKLFVLSTSPKIYKKGLKVEIDRIFTDFEKYSLLLSNPEYYKCLKIAFPTWSQEEVRTFTSKSLNHFRRIFAKYPDQNWHKKYCFELLSTIYTWLTEDEKQIAQNLLGKTLDKTFEPEPDLLLGKAGFVQDRSPVDFADEKYIEITAIINDLKGDLSPAKIQEKYKDDNFLNPRNVEGVGNKLKEDIKRRISQYLTHASEFLDANIAIHYTYSFLYGIEEYLKENGKLSKKDWDNLFILFYKIKESHRADSAQEDGRWLARWEWLEKTMADILKSFTGKANKETFIEKRKETLDLITYLIEKETAESDVNTTNLNDLYTKAINSTNGIAFEALVNLIYQDGETLEYKVAQFYDNLIDNCPLHIKFLIGRYLASFYYRDKLNVKTYFDRIFPREKDKRDEFFAAWEGYLSSALYKEIFDDLEEYYAYALNIKSSDYPDRKRFRDLDEGIGTHLALAFAHFKDVNYKENKKNKLLELLWTNGDVKKQKEFISFLGRGIISHGNAGKEWFDEQKIDLQKLKDFWEIIVNEKDIDSEVYSAFGFWINHKIDIFNDYSWLADIMAKTLTKSNGNIEWDHGLIKQLPKLAAANPLKTLIILEKYLIDGLLTGKVKTWFHLDESKISAFETLYKSEPDKTKDLINKLLEKGGRPFWPLRKIVSD